MALVGSALAVLALPCKNTIKNKVTVFKCFFGEKYSPHLEIRVSNIFRKNKLIVF